VTDRFWTDASIEEVREAADSILTARHYKIVQRSEDEVRGEIERLLQHVDVRFEYVYSLATVVFSEDAGQVQVAVRTDREGSYLGSNRRQPAQLTEDEVAACRGISAELKEALEEPAASTN
jgi:hypothetical protein